MAHFVLFCRHIHFYELHSIIIFLKDTLCAVKKMLPILYVDINSLCASSNKRGSYWYRCNGLEIAYD